jgi:hypothetical protein
MRWLHAGSALVLLAALSRPAAAEDRWLGCKYVDINGKTQNFFLVFDDRRSVAALFDVGYLLEGTNTSITFQAIRTRFPDYALTYNRNDGTLAINPRSGGILNGDCRRVAKPADAPNLP